MKKYFGEAMIVTGVFILIYSLLSFSGYRDCGIRITDMGACNSPAKYSYGANTKAVAGIGGILITVGVLLVRRKKMA